MGSNVEVADFVTVAMRFANQHLAHVPTVAAAQTTLTEPRHQPAVATGVSTATWPRPSTTHDRRLTRVSDGAPGPVVNEPSRTKAQAPPSWVNLVDGSLCGRAKPIRTSTARRAADRLSEPAVRPLALNSN